MQAKVEQPYFRGVALQQSFIVSVLYSKICKPKTKKKKSIHLCKKKIIKKRCWKTSLICTF